MQRRSRSDKTRAYDQKSREIDRRNDEIAVNQEIANNENEQREVRERAREKAGERQNVADLEEQNEKLREAPPLREQVLEILKNYGFTLLATGVTIGAAIGALFNPLKKLDKGIGKGLQTMSKKLGLICAIVSFIFKAEHVPQAQSLTLTNRQTSQKNCSHNDQRLVYVITRERWGWVRWRGEGWSGRWLWYCSPLWNVFGAWLFAG